MAGFINLSDFHAAGDPVAVTISSTVDLITDFGGWPKLLVQAAGGDARFSFTDKDPGTSLHILKADDVMLVNQHAHLKFKGTTLIVTPGR